MPKTEPEPPAGQRTTPEELGAQLVQKGILSPNQLDPFLRGLAHRHAALDPAGAPEEVLTAALDPRSRTGRYIRVKPLGRGGRSLVWLAWDTDLGRFVALKILISAEDPAEVHRFHREAQTAARLSHPNIIPIHEVGHELDAQGRTLHFIAMDYVEGLPLNRMRLDIAASVAVLRDCALAAHYAHSQGIIHRDIKPSNIMVDKAGHTFLMDFGLAKPSLLPSTLTISGQILGTPSYMSPEQAMGRINELTPRSDVYSLGATLYEVTTGQKPFEGDDPYEILRQVIEKDPIPPRKLKSAISLDLETIILRALDKDPARRFESAKEFAEDLTRTLAGDPIKARRTSRFSQAARLAKKHKPLAILGTVLLVTIVAGAGIAVWQRIAARARAEAAEGEKKLAAGRGAVKSGDASRAAAEFLGALDIPAGEPTAQLAALYFEQWKKHWDNQQYEFADQMEILVRAFDKNGRYTEALRREGVIELELESDPTGATVTVRPYVARDDGLLVADDRQEMDFGSTPVTRVLATGSYVFTIRKPGYRDVLFPVLVGRNTRHKARVRLYTDAQIGDGFVYVPGGPFIAGLDPKVDRPGRLTPDVPDFFIAKHEVTCGEYLKFVNDICRKRGKTAALARVPRGQEGAGFYWGYDLEKMAIVLSGEWLPEWPVMTINWDDARAYCEWLTEQAQAKGEGVKYRLPRENEWEKAARGADGRLFPWGNTFSKAFCSSIKPKEEPTPEPIGAHREDCSPYGIMDMAGGVREWCLDDWPDQAGWKVLRGGSWAVVDSLSFHAAYRVGMRPGQVKSSQGIRVVRELVK